MFAAARSALTLVHYWWPLVVGWSVTLVVHRATLRAPDPEGLALLLCGICAAYSLDRLLDAPRTAVEPWIRRALRTAVAGGTVMGAVLLSRLPLETAVTVPVVGAIALAYRQLKRLPLAKNFFVPVVWTWMTIALPFHDGSWFGWRWVAEPVAAPLFLLFAANVLLSDLKDESIDRRDGLPSLAVVWGGRTAAWVAGALALGAALAAHGEARPGLALSAVSLGVTAMRPQLLATDIVGPLLVDVIVSLPGFLIVWQLV